MGITALLVGTAATPTAAATAGLIGTAGAVSSTAAFGIGVAVAGAAAKAGGFGKPDRPDLPTTAKSTTQAKTAKRIEPVTDPDKKKRQQAAIFAGAFAPPKLGQPGLLGLGV